MGTGVYFSGNFERGFGTFPLRDDVVLEAITTAVEVGYRSFDTAQMYGNESEVGEALRSTGISRSDFFITTKVHPDNYSDEGKFIGSVELSLRTLDLDYIDVLLLHWPPSDGDIAPSLRFLEESLKRGLVRHIGVSNYTVTMLRSAIEIIDAPISVNQVEFHPLLDQRVLLAGATELGIPLSSYCSVARGAVFEHSLFDEIGASHNKVAGQVVLRWILQHGVSVNAMSKNPEHIRSNFDIADFTLSEDEILKIDNLMSTNHRIVTSNVVPWAPDWD